VTFEFAVATSAQPLMDELTAAYRATHGHVSFKTSLYNSTHAVEALWTGQVDLAVVSRLTESERDAVWMTPIAIDGVAIVVHPGNPVRDLAILQVRDIFRGRIANWQDVGGPKGDALVLSRESNSGTRAKFEETVMEGRNVTVNAVMASSDAAVLDYCRSVTTAIGYVASGYVTDSVKALAVEGIPLTPATLAEQRYPLSRPLIVITPEEPQGELRAFVAWILGPEGQALVGKKYGRVK
jgi:phosphate transport system substrate-binding protein